MFEVSMHIQYRLTTINNKKKISTFGWYLAENWYFPDTLWIPHLNTKVFLRPFTKRKVREKNYCGNPRYCRGWRATNRRHKKADVSVAGEERHSTGHNLFKLLELLEPLFLPQQHKAWHWFHWQSIKHLPAIHLQEHQEPAAWASSISRASSGPLLASPWGCSWFGEILKVQ